MGEKRVPTPDTGVVDLDRKPGGNPLGFSLEFREQSALVELADRRVANALHIDRLELEVPSVTFPFDVSGGAEQFRHRRCRLRLLAASIHESDLARVLRGLLEPDRYGIADVDVQLADGAGRLTGVFSVGGDSARFSARFYVEPGEDLTLRFGFFDIRLFGWSPVPASSLVAVLARACERIRLQQAGAGVLVNRPIQDLLRWLLPTHGWKVPDLQGLRIDRIRIADGRLRLETARFPDELMPVGDPQSQASRRNEREVLVFKEGEDIFSAAEAALREGRLDEARSLYLRRGEVEPGHPLAARRLLEIGLTRPERADELQDLIRDRLARETDDVHALLIQAAMLERLGDPTAGRSYERAARACVTRAERADAVLAHLRAGELLAEPELDRATANLEQILVLEPDHVPAMLQLAELYERGQRWYRALRLHLRLAKRQESAAQVAARYSRMGVIYLERFDDLERARKHLDAALTNDPDNVEALVHQARVQQRRGQSTRAARLLGRVLDLAEEDADPVQLLDTRLRLAHLWEDDLGDPEIALAHYTEILRDNADHLDALFRAGRLAMELDQPDQAAESFSRLLDLEEAGEVLPDDVVKSAGMNLGRIYLERPGGEAEARSQFARVVAIDPTELEAWRELENLDRAVSDWTNLVDVLEQKSVLLTDSDQALAALLEAAKVAGEQLDDPRRAEVFYRRALEMAPRSNEALEGLSAMLRRDERWSELEENIVGSIRQDLDQKVAASRWAMLGRLRVEQLGDLTSGLHALALAIKLDPADHQNAKRLLTLYRENKRFADYVELIPRLDPESFDRSVWIDLWLERARILAENLDRPEEAIESYRQALERDPDLLQAQRALADLHFVAGQWKDAAEATSKVLELAGEGGLSGPGKTDLHRRLAAVELELGNRQVAVEQYLIVLSRFEEDEEAAEKISRILREDQRWEELAAFYARRAERLEGEAAAALHTAAATIWWDRLSRIEPAASQYQAAVDAAPDSEGAPARLGSLQRLYAEQGEWNEVAGILRRRISLGQPEDVPALQMALASVLDVRLEDPSGARACWMDSLAVDPDFQPALMLLGEHHYAEGDYEEAIEFGGRALDAARREKLEAPEKAAAYPAEQWAQLALNVARAAWELGEKEKAIQFYSAHVEAFAERGYADVEQEALERLELLLREVRQYDALALLYRRWLKAGRMPDRHAGLKRSLALLLFEHLDQPDEAIQVLGDFVRENSEDQPALRELIEMLRRASRWEQLARLLSENWEAAASQEERIARLEELAELYLLRLHDSASAIACLSQLLELGHRPAMERLLGAYQQEGRHAELAKLLSDEARKSEDTAESADLWCQVGKLARDELKDRTMALDAFESAFEAVPSPNNRADVLTLLREAGQAERLGAFLARCIVEAEDPEEQRHLLLEHAETCLTRMDDRVAALGSLREALNIQPEEAVAHRALSLYEDLEDWEGVADMQEVLVDLAENEPAAARRLYKLGQVYVQHLDAPERATAAFEAAANLDPSWLEPNLALAEVLADEEQWEELVEVKVRIGQAVEGRRERGQALREAAGLVFQHLGNPQYGVELLRKASELITDSAPILFELAERLEQIGEPAEAADILERLVGPEGTPFDAADEAETPAALNRRIASLRQEAGEDLAAIAAYERTLRAEPSDGESAERLEALYRENGRHEDLAQMLTSLAKLRDGELAGDTWLSVAKCWLETGDSEAAESALQNALAAAPDHPGAGAVLAGMLTEQEDWPRLLALLEGLPDDLLGEDELTHAVLSCFEGIGEEPESADQELAACRVMLRINPLHLSALERAAILLERAGQADESEELLRRLDEQADVLPDDNRYLLDLRLASIEFARGRTEEAELRLKRCIEARPDDPGPRAFLHKLYEGVQRFADRVGLLLEEAERFEDPGQRFEKLNRAAQLMEQELGDPEGAAQLFERVVEREPSRLEAWRRLAELYRLLDDPKRQRESLLRLAELSGGDEKVRALRKAARISGDVLEIPEARQDFENLLAANPEDTEALDRLLELDRQEGDKERLEDHLARRAAVTDDRSVLTGLLRERAQLLLDDPERETEAIDVLEEIHDLLPTDSGPLETLYEIYVRHELWERAADALQGRISLTGTERERAPMLNDLAALRSEHLDDPEGAVEAWRQALALDPSNLKPLHRMRQLAVTRWDRNLLVDTLEALAARAEDEVDELLLRRSVGLVNWSLGQRDDARRTFSRVLEIDEDDLVARRLTARILFEQDPRLAIPHLRWLAVNFTVLTEGDRLKVQRQLVEGLAEAEPIERIEALEQLLELGPDIRATRDLAALYRDVGDRKSLGRLLEQLGEFEAEQGDPASFLERAELLLQDGEAEQAALAMQRALDLDGPHRFDLALRLAGLQRDSLVDSVAATASLEVAAGLEPEDLSVLEQLADLHEGSLDWEKARAVLETLEKLVEDEQERSGLNLRLGIACLELGLDEEARTAFQKAVQLDPACVQAYERLEGLLDGLADTQRGMFYLDWAGGPAAGGRRPGLYLEAGRHLIAAGDQDSAIHSLRETLKLDPAGQEAFALLVPIVEEREEWEELRSLLENWLKVEEDDGRRAGLAFDLGFLALDRFSDSAGAADAFEQCLKVEPDHARALEELADLRFEAEDWVQAAQLYDRLGDGVSDEQSTEVAIRRGELAEELQDQAGAVELFRIAVELAPQEARANLGLIRNLERVGREADASEAIDAMVLALEDSAVVEQTLVDLEKELVSGAARANLLARITEAEAEVERPELWLERADLMIGQSKFADAASALESAMRATGSHRYEAALRLARVRIEHLEDEEGGVQALELALEIEPDALEVLMMLSDLYWSLEKWDSAAELTGRLLKSADEGARPGLALRLGDIRSAQEQVEAARTSYEQAIELDPAYRQAYERLEQLLAAAGDGTALAGFYLGWARSPAAGSKRSLLYLTAARQFERDGQIESAIVTLQEALKSDSDNPELFEKLVPLLGQEQRWEQFLELMDRRRDLALEDDRRVALTFEMGQLCMEQLNDFERAAGYFIDCLDIDPDHAGSIEELAGIRYSQGDWGAAFDLYEHLGDSVSSAGRFLVAFRLGEMLERRGDLEQALERYLSSSRANPTFLPPRQHAIRLLSEAGRWEQVVDGIRSLLEVLPDEGFEDMELDLKRQLAVGFRRLLRFDEAATVLVSVLERDPEDLGTIRALKDYHTNLMDWPRAVELFHRQLDLDPQAEDAAACWESLGDILNRRIGESESAEEAYVASFELQPERASAGFKAWELMLGRGAWEDLIQLGPRLLAAPLDPSKQADVHAGLGRALARLGEDPAQALEHFSQVLSGGFAELELVEDAADAARKAGAWAQYASLAGQALEVRMDKGLDPEIAMESYLELARVYQEELEDVTRAAAAVRRALELHPRDPELLRRLGHLYSSNFDTYREAIEVFRELLGMDPTDPEFFRYLARLEAARGDTDRTVCYYTGLRFLQPGDQEARRYLNYVGPSGRPNRPIDRQEWDGVFLHPSADCLLQRIMSALAPYVEQLFPANLPRFELLSGDGVEQLELLQNVARHASWLVSGRETDLVIAKENVYQAWVESGVRPTIVISSTVIDRSSPGELVFFVTREVIKVAMGCVLPMKFARSDLRQLLAIVSQLAEGDAEPIVPLPATATQYIDAIRRATPPAILEMAEPLIRRFALQPQAHDLDRWITGVNRTADRVGLLACGDLNAALAVMTRYSSAAGGRELAFVPDRSALLTSDEELLALFRFAFSEQYLKLRTALGLDSVAEKD